jgi:hypothetical protein
MSVSYSAVATLYRSTNKDRFGIKKIGFRSDGIEELQSSLDFSDAANPPNLPVNVVTPNINTITFLGIICTGGGTATVRITSGNNVGKYIDIPICNGSILMSGVELKGVVVISVEGLGYLEIFGSGLK